ncbi:MAG: hypothetical protein K0R19_1346 [Bacillota bacterium]|jgi:PleD family two-component response regulator|nr:hypothetical protein [Bacillota bacterium]
MDNKIKVLILTDRLQDQAKALIEFLKQSGFFEVVGFAENKQQVHSIAEDRNFDYLIIAGYLKNETNYHVIAELRNEFKRFHPVQWAMVDSLINIFCLRYQIPLKFERTLPMDEFADFLRTHKNDPLIR